MSFDWQTEDRDWDNRETPRAGPRPPGRPPLDAPLFDGPEPATAPAARPARDRRHRLLFLGAAISLALALAAVVYWQLAQRTRAAEARVTAEVLASHDTLLDAARAADAELFVSFLSGRDTEWARAQELLVRDGRWLDRAAFDLTWDPQPAAVPTPTVTLAPDLLAAELAAPQIYIVDAGNGVMAPVTLVQTAVFRLGPDRWLFAPPEEAFWGQERELTGRYLRLRYPARDEVVAARLARDLDATLAEFCRAANDACAGQGRLEMIFSPDPASLVAYSRPETAWSGGGELTLPAPTLFGLPVDEDGYRAVHRAYAARAVSAAAANLTGWACCDRALVYGVLRHALLHRLGLKAWPVSDADYTWLAARPDELGRFARRWGEPSGNVLDPERRTLYLVIDFLINRDGAPPIIEMQRRLLDGTAATYWDWIAGATGGAYGSPADFESDLLRYAVERRARTASAHPFPSPAPWLPFFYAPADVTVWAEWKRTV